MIKTSKKIHIGLKIFISKSIFLEVTKLDEKLFRVKLFESTFTRLLEEFGHVPLPPYINR